MAVLAFPGLQNILMTAGVALAKKDKYNTFTNYKPVSRILKIWRYNQKNLKKKNIAVKIAQKTHSPYKSILEDFENIKSIIVKNNIYGDFKLTEEEIEFLKM